MKGALFNKLFDSLSTPDISTLTPDCPSGNCTWKVFPTLGICSECRDLTSSLTYTTEGPQAYSWYHEGQAVINMNQQLQVSYINDMWRTSNDPAALRPMVFKGHKFTLGHFAGFSFPANAEETRIEEGQIAPYAAECILGYCGQAIQSSVVNGKLQETVLRTWNGTSLNTTDGSLTIHAPTPSLALAIPNMKVDFLDWISLQVWLWQTFNGTRQSAFDDQSSNGVGGINDATQAIQSILTKSNISAVFERVATSMTNVIRANSLHSEPVHGVASKGTIFVMVRWCWLVLPAGLVLFVIIFLIATMVVSARHNLPPWRSSALAVMACGLDDDMRQALADAEDSVSSMMAVAARSKGILRCNSGHWYIATNDGKGISDASGWKPLRRIGTGEVTGGAIVHQYQGWI